jgi:hypothetical protein
MGHSLVLPLGLLNHTQAALAAHKYLRRRSADLPYDVVVGHLQKIANSREKCAPRRAALLLCACDIHQNELADNQAR